MIIGIDLGTTNSVVGHLSSDGPQLIPNALGSNLTPSVIGIDKDGTVLVGQAAKEYQVSFPDRCASLFKRHMGSEWTTKLADKEYRAEELSSFILRALKEDAEAKLFDTVDRAVITVPAYFNDDQRTATIRAGELAGLKVERIINEPTAAAIAYGVHESDEEKVVVVFDLGGGTFDVSIVEFFEGTVEVRASSGECFLGGEDFTRAIASRILSSRGMVFEHAELKAPELVSRLINQCEEAKLQLATRDAAKIRIPETDGQLNENSESLELTRGQFAEWTDSILARVELPIRRCMGDASLSRADIDDVILVGGATRMPEVMNRVGNMFGKIPHSRLNQDEVVALGAALQAGLIDRNESVDELVVTDVAPFTLGVEICKQIGGTLKDGYFMPVINRNTTIPVSRVERVSTVRANQTVIQVKVYQGESRRIDDNILLGELELNGLPMGPAGQDVDIRFTYDMNGVLEVEAIAVKTKKKQQMVISRHARGMNKKQIAEAVRQMQEMKTHPREEAANRLLLKRAERVYRELPLFQREALGDLLDGFEAALESQDKEVVERFRLELEIALNSLEADDGDSQESFDE